MPLQDIQYLKDRKDIQYLKGKEIYSVFKRKGFRFIEDWGQIQALPDITTHWKGFHFASITIGPQLRGGP